MRIYANPSIGLLGRGAARSLGDDFVSLMRKEVFSPLGLASTWYQAPEEVTEDYAQGYTRAGDPIRLATGVLAAETYGVRTTVDDLLRFIAANLNRLDLDQELQRAITATHVAWFDVGVMSRRRSSDSGGPCCGAESLAQEH